MEYLTVAEVRDECGDDVAELSDAAILRKIDRLVGFMEYNLGHTFGRALRAWSSDANHTVQVTASALVIGGDSYAFADYATLGSLTDAVNNVGAAYRVELLPKVVPDTPSSLLKATGALVCGATYDKRQMLDLTALWLRARGGQTHVFLPLPLRSVSAVIENGTTLTADQYYAVAGKSWLVRKACECPVVCAVHVVHWGWRTYDGIQVTYRPTWWGQTPAAIQMALLEAFKVDLGIAPSSLESERFGQYSYSNRAPEALTYRDILGGGMLRAYAVALRS